MRSSSLFRVGEWSAYLSGFGIAFGLVPMILIVIGGDPFSAPLGSLHYVALFFSPLLSLPIPITLEWIYRREAGRLGSVVMILGVAGMLYPVGLTVLEYWGGLYNLGISVVLAGWVMLGLWLVLMSYVGFGRGGTYGGFVILGQSAGVSLMLSVYLESFTEAVSSGGVIQGVLYRVGTLMVVVGFMGYAIWLLWLGARLRALALDESRVRYAG